MANEKLVDLHDEARKNEGIYARDTLLRMVANFPGLCPCEEHENREVNGADLVEWVANEIYYLWSENLVNFRELIEERAKSGTPWCEACDSPLEQCECLGPVGGVK